jgi:YggT family protein
LAPRRKAAGAGPALGPRALAAAGRAAYLGAHTATAMKAGISMGSLILVLLFILKIVWWIVLAHVIMSWLINFNVLNRRQPLVSNIWYGLERVLEPIYGPIRRVLPNMGGLDLAPLVLIVIIYALQTILIRNAYMVM